MIYVMQFYIFNGYENWESYLEQFFRYFPLISEKEYHYAQLKLVGESSTWCITVNKHKSHPMGCNFIFVHIMFRILYSIIQQSFLRPNNSILNVKDTNTPLTNTLLSSTLPVKNFQILITSVPWRVQILTCSLLRV